MTASQSIYVVCFGLVSTYCIAGVLCVCVCACVRACVRVYISALPQVDVFSFDVVLVPVHLGIHWTLAVSGRIQSVHYSMFQHRECNVFEY